MTRACDQPARIQRSRRGLDGGGSAERPGGFGSPGSPLARGQPGQAAFHLGVQRGPAGEAVLAGHRQLGRRQRYPFRESTDPGQGRWLAVSGCAKQLAGLAAELVEVGAVRKLGHDVSSRPRLACGLSKKTILPESITRNRGGLRSCPRTRRRPLTPTGKAYSVRTGPSSSPNLDQAAAPILGPEGPDGSSCAQNRRASARSAASLEAPCHAQTVHVREVSERDLNPRACDLRLCGLGRAWKHISGRVGDMEQVSEDRLHQKTHAHTS